MKIAVDAMGGDFAPLEIVKGAIRAVRAYQDVQVVLVGDETKIRTILKEYKMEEEDRLSIYHASEVIEMGETPSVALRKKKDASVAVATRLVKEGVCDAVVAPGSTGAAVAAALFGLGRIKGIDRPAIATTIPTPKGICVMLDSGANANSKAKHLVENAIMGYHYAKIVTGKTHPSVGLLNIGEEKGKGNDLTKETYPLLEAMETIPFHGNVEGRDIPKGTVDVVVCDGFVGNVALKVAEGVVTVLLDFLKEGILKGGVKAKMGALLLKPVFKRLKKRMDHTEFGGAPLLGVKGVFIIAHGSSKEKDIQSAIRTASELVRANMITAISESVKKEGGSANDET